MKKINASYCLSRRWLKLLLIMKFTWIFILAGILGANAESYSQNVKLDLKVENATLKSVLHQIEEKTDYYFFYKNDEIENLNSVSIDTKQASISEVLDVLLKDKGFNYEVHDRYILLQKRGAEQSVRNFLQQQKNISGRVADSSGAPLPGVTVYIKGTTQGTITDGDGNYSLPNVSGDGILVFSFVGMKSQEIAVDGRTIINLTMEEETFGIDEVVAIAYGNTTQRKTTGSLQTVKSSELEDIPVAQITQKLQGKFAGVKINQGTGRLGQGISVQIRGAASLSTSSTPLYVIDGFPIVGDISSINPAEIETITVLKDAASTSLYGSRAAFGVVLITTKSARFGQTNISVNAYTGFQQVPQKGRPDMMNGTEWAQFKKEYYEDLGQTVPEAYQNPEQYGEGYNWYDAMLRTGKINDYSISIRTSKEKYSSAIVAGFFSQEGVVLNSDYKRFSLRANTLFNLTDNLKLGVNVAPTYSYGNNPYSDGGFANSGGLLYNAVLTPPVLPYQNEDGTYPASVTTPGITTFPTPNWVKSIKETTNNEIKNRLLSNAYLEYEPIRKLILKASVNVDLGQALSHYFQPSTAGRQFASAPSQLNAYLSEYNNRYWSWLSENTVSYSKELDGHSFDVLGGYTAQKYRFDASSISGSNYSDDRVQTIDAALVKNNPSMDIQEWSMISYLARLNYSYKNKYLFTASIRRDGSSRFGSNNKWGNFPAISVGWVVSEESFAKSINWISYLKVRGGYGITGNNNIGNYTQYSTVASGVNVPFNNSTASGIAVTNIGNEELGWENTKEIGFGLDLNILKDRISFTYDYYTKNTSNLLYSLSVPVESGFSSFTGNVGKIKFWGHEFNVNSNNLVRDFKWSTNFNISFSDNVVKELSALSDSLFVQNGVVGTVTRVGGRIGQFYGMVQDGVYVDQADFDNSSKLVDSQVGTVKFRDVNGDGEITVANSGGDKTEIGNPFPKFIFGLTNSFSYKDFDLSIVATGSYGNKIAAAMDQGVTNLDGVFNVLREVKDRWRSPDNPGTGLYGKTTGSTGHERDDFNTRYINDGGYLAIKNITLGYTVKAKRLKFIKDLRLYASIQQAFIFSSYKGNPEAGIDVDGNMPGSTLQGIDYSTYPIPRTFTFGVNVNLK